MPAKNKQYTAIIRAVFGEAWALTEEKLRQVCDLLEMRANGRQFSRDEIVDAIGEQRLEEHSAAIRAANDDRKPYTYHPESGIAILPLVGLISKRMDMFTWVSGGTSTDRFARQLRLALRDDDVSAILIDVDSPGGSVSGTIELAEEIYQARGQKPVWASANTEAHSAAYWLASAAERFDASPSAMVGSVGVYMIHTDTLKAQEKAGIKQIVIKAGKYKAEGVAEELSDAAVAHRQSIVDARYSSFVAGVARHRGVSVATVLSQFGDGRSLIAEDAAAQGMIDRVVTIEQTYAELAATVAAKESQSTSVYIGQRAEGVTDMKVTQAIFAAMVTAGVCQSADRERAEPLLTAFMAGRIDPAASEDDIVAALGRVRPVTANPPVPPAATANPPQPAASAVGSQPTANPPQPAASAVGSQNDDRAGEIMAAIRLAALPAGTDTLALATELIAAQDNQGRPLGLRDVMQRLQDRESAASRPPTTSVAVVGEARDRFHTAAVDQILARHFGGSAPEQVWDHRARAYRPFQVREDNYSLRSLNGLARECLQVCGIGGQQLQRLSAIDIASLVMGGRPDDYGLQAAADGPAFNVSGMFTNILFDAQNVTLRRSFDDGRTTYQLWMRRGEDIPDFKPAHAVLAGQTGDPQAIPEDGEFSEDTMTDTKESYKLTVWGKMWSQSFQSVVNDRLGAFMEVPTKQGTAMRRKLNKIAYGQLLDNSTMAEDATALFHADHSNLTHGASKKPNDTTEISIMTKKLMEQRGLGADASALNLEARWMLVPPNTRTEALELVRSTSPPLAGGSAAGTSGRANVFENSFDVIVEAELGANSSNGNGSDTAWYLATDSQQCEHIVYAYLQGLPTPRMEREMAFDRLAQKQRCWFAFAVKTVEWRGLQKHTGLVAP